MLLAHQRQSLSIKIGARFAEKIDPIRERSYRPGQLMAKPSR